ncbi:MAG: tRNA pseudouridine(38-40) synthase TruA [Solirubrobacteraceae bacterium]
MVTRLTLQYDGTEFFGWACQPDQRTVQAELEGALRRILGDSDSDGKPLTVTVAGRTDRGVHAWGQVVSYRHEAVDPQRLNSLLAKDMAVLACEPAADTFDARRDATSRTYCYRVLARRTRDVFERGRALWWPRPLDTALLDECAKLLPGCHDFTAFTPTETEHTRFKRNVIGAHWHEVGDVLELWIEADTFLRHMNRVLVGTMLEIAAGRRELAEFAELLEGRPRSHAGATASAHGLALASVAYAPA